MARRQFTSVDLETESSESDDNDDHDGSRASRSWFGRVQRPTAVEDVSKSIGGLLEGSQNRGKVWQLANGTQIHISRHRHAVRKPVVNGIEQQFNCQCAILLGHRRVVGTFLVASQLGGCRAAAQRVAHGQ